MWMNPDTILEVDGASKLFSRHTIESQRRLGEVIRAACSGRDFTVAGLRGKEFWALDNINFTLDRGDAIGIIGLNGAGKTTLLRMLNGQFPPDRGEIRIAGQTASMIDLTAGLNDQMTGRENIYLRSASIGRAREEVDEIIDEMIEFMELGDALESPISTYSSGMRMRLAFATTVFVNPDLLIIDEVLSVGDFRFRQKCLEHIRKLRAQSAFVFASHSMRDICQFCTEAIVLEKGRIAFKGEPDDAVKYFQETEAARAKTKRSAGPGPMGHFIDNERAVSDVTVSIEGIDEEKNSIARGDKLNITIDIAAAEDLDDLSVGFPVWDRNDVLVTAYSSEFHFRKVSISQDTTRRFTLSIDTQCLNPGTYKPVIVIKSGVEFLYRQKTVEFDIVDRDMVFHWGAVTLPHEWKLN